MRRFELQGELRAGYARVLHCDVADVALTTSTSEGIGAVMAGLDIGPGDEIVSSDQEHPGVIGPLKAARDRGAAVRLVPMPELAEAVTRDHDAGGLLARRLDLRRDRARRARGARDPRDPRRRPGGRRGPRSTCARSNCAAYAASGQKWLCGADGTGMLYVAPEWRERIRPVAPSYVCFEDTTKGLESPYKDDARRYDTPSLSREAAALSVAALHVLERHGLDDVIALARAHAATLAERLEAAGKTVAPRGDSTLVAWEEADPEAARDRLAEAGVAVRNLPGRPLVRASVGAWNDEDDLERLLSVV